jgi:hypothetical protein
MIIQPSTARDQWNVTGAFTTVAFNNPPAMHHAHNLTLLALRYTGSQVFMTLYYRRSYLQFDV